jgi:hypothetical protein
LRWAECSCQPPISLLNPMMIWQIIPLGMRSRQRMPWIGLIS